MNKIEIKKIGLRQIAQLQKIGKQTFFETFASANTQDNMQKYLEGRFSVDKLSTELKNPYSAFYFAILDHEAVGYAKINFGPAQTELKDPKAIEIERIYVLEAYHGKKIGQLLFDTIFGLAKQKNADYVWLGVWEENLKAINFYKKNGFVPFDKHIFTLGDEVQTDIMMKLNLDADHTTRP